ncbi:MAG: helix-turn-helix domain-containing protein [Deltaproteobacteria bacterium]|nr:helix-turn-helix domain-containing protein [Deltaproteobacteria bacterium]
MPRPRGAPSQAERHRGTLEGLGARIRTERTRLGLSLDALARRVGVSKMTLQRIETGVTSPSIVTLAEISYHLKRPVESLIREGDAKVVVLRNGDQESLFDPAQGIRVVAPQGLISERIVITHAELKAGTVIDAHTNRGFEWALLTEGAAVIGVGDKEYRVEGGDAIFYDAHYPHWIRVERDVRYVGLFLRDS